MIDGNVLVTGGAGTLGRAIARLREQEGWKGKLTVYSTDDHKHDVMRKDHPDVHFVQGDIRNPETLCMAMIGHDVVIHAAAVKVIPVSEEWSIDTIDVNIYGSLNVCAQAIRAGVQHVLGISTDKACHPHNLYGATKMAMEKVFQEYASSGIDTQFHLVRYGNVLESTGSVVEAWRESVKEGKPIKITDPSMTRFWLSPMQAARYVVESLGFPPGMIYIPRMQSLEIGKLADYTVGLTLTETIPLRPGEKMHETLLTEDELSHAVFLPSRNGFLLSPSVAPPVAEDGWIRVGSAYTSHNASRLTKEALQELLADV